MILNTEVTITRDEAVDLMDARLFDLMMEQVQVAADLEPGFDQAEVLLDWTVQLTRLDGDNLVFTLYVDYVP